MPKVLRIINRFNLGGPTYNAAYLTKYLGNGFETLLIGGAKDETEGSSEFILKNLGLDYKVIPEMRRSINPLLDYQAYNKIKDIIKEFKPDIVHTHAAKAGALGRKAAFACNVPVTVHTFHGHVFHSYFNSFQTWYIKRIERALAKRTTAIVAISDKQKLELTEEHAIAPKEKVHVIPLGFDLDRFAEHTSEKRITFRKRYNMADGEVAIGIIGRLVPIKNHKLFIDAISYVKAHTNQKIRAFIIGDGETRSSLEKKVNDLNLRDLILFTSWEKNIDMVYPGLDIVCLTSLNEGTPVSLIEAQAASKPIVSTDVGGITNVVIPDKTALISNAADESLFHKNLLTLVDNRSMREEMCMSGYDFVINRFSYQRLITDTEALYKKLVK